MGRDLNILAFFQKKSGLQNGSIQPEVYYVNNRTSELSLELHYSALPLRIDLGTGRRRAARWEHLRNKRFVCLYGSVMLLQGNTKPGTRLWKETFSNLICHLGAAGSSDCRPHCIRKPWHSVHTVCSHHRLPD